MNFKTKAVALLAGSALALSVASGAMADSTSVEGTATLGGGSCAVTMNASGDFGSWTYDGTTSSYSASGSTTLTISGTITEGDPRGCDLNIAFPGLERDADGDSNIDIGLSHFSATFNEAGPSPLVTIPAGSLVGSYDIGGGSAHSGSADITYTLVSVPNKNEGNGPMIPGTYRGTVKATFSNAV